MCSPRKRLLLALLTVYLGWGSTYLAIRFALLSFPPLLLMGSRFLAAGALLFIWARWRGAQVPALSEWRDATVSGILLLGGGMGLTAIAQQYVSSGMSAVICASAPFMLACWSGLFGHWPTGREWGSIVSGFMGIVFLVGSSEMAAHMLGVLLLCIAVGCWTLGSVLTRKTLALATGSMGAASEMLAGGGFLVAAGLIRGESLPAVLDPRAISAWIYLTVVGSLAAFTAYKYLLSNTRPAVASSYAYVNPVIAVLLGVAILDEFVSHGQFVAMIMILCSVLALTLTGGTRASTGRASAGEATAAKASS